ncbi:YHYH domain-containing protein [Devosia neptuniae]|uniref:YHYH domain-containing protein n=1 Tax=Devosia neptuniae TaxID=191302 RepID=A0ABY6CCF2_9HYPH|nr:YHYH domain-containing protein [Devosia neptuniae]UXN69922.1 YHYH domain-containing protein [Devosia neptuniae]
MKKIVSVALAALLCMSISTTVFAHGGGLNKDGCHNETKTGGYHCH